MQIPKDVLAKLRRIEIITARIANAQLAGAYHSVFKGIGIAFSEVRQYQPGDDVRRIDWNVTARMRDAYVKLFVEEREMTVMLLVDASGSLLFGSCEESKREVAAQVAALLAFSAIKNNDRVGLIIFTDHVEKFIPPKKGKKHVLGVIQELLTFTPSSRRTDLRAALDFLGRVQKRKSVAFLVSDFLRPAGAGAALSDLELAFRVAARRHDLVPIAVRDPLEEELPALGLCALEDLESGEIVEFDTYSRGRKLDAEAVRRARAEREQLWRRLKLDSINVSTDPRQPYVNALIAFFRQREQRLSH